MIGTHVCGFHPEATIVGNIASVTHSVDPNGNATTSVVIPEELDPGDPMAELPASARRLFLREVQP